MTTTAENFREVTRLAPCQICGKGDWCIRSAGAHGCKRVHEDHAAGFKRIKRTAECSIYVEPDRHTVPKHPPSGNGHGKASQNNHKKYPDENRAARAAAEKAGGTVEEIYEWSPTWVRVRIKLDGDPPKTFRECTKSGDGWILKGPDTPHCLFGEIPTAGLITVHEGEKCVMAARSIGLYAVTSGGSTSADKADWSSLKGREVAIFPDLDTPGAAYAQAVAAKLQDLGCTVRIVELPGLPEHGDLADFVEARDGQEADAIRAAIMAEVEKAEPVKEAASPTESTATLINLGTDITSTKVDWFWYRRIARKSITLVIGEVGSGKTTAVMDIAATATVGRSWPLNTDEYRPRPCNVLLIVAEDDLSMTVKPRFEAAGGDANRVTVLTAVKSADGKEYLFSTKHDHELLRRIIRQKQIELLIIDPLALFMSRTDQHRHSEVYAALAPLSRVAQDEGIAIIAVTHVRKGESRNALEKTMGSQAFVAICRNVWEVRSDPDEPESDTRWFAHAKASLSRLQPALSFTIEDVPETHTSRVNWMGMDNRTADEFNTEANSKGDTDKSSVDEACEWLKANLTALPASSKELFGKAEAEGVTRNAFYRAKKKLGVKSQPQKDEKGRIKDWLVWLPAKVEAGATA